MAFFHMQNQECFILIVLQSICTTTLSLHEDAHRISYRHVDAPVSGGVAAAAAATLTFMVGWQ